MRSILFLALLLAIGLVVLTRSLAQAQVPPHQPGAVCYTPNFWCWAQQPARSGGVFDPAAD